MLLKVNDFFLSYQIVYQLISNMCFICDNKSIAFAGICYLEYESLDKIKIVNNIILEK